MYNFWFIHLSGSDQGASDFEEVEVEEKEVNENNQQTFNRYPNWLGVISVQICKSNPQFLSELDKIIDNGQTCIPLICCLLIKGLYFLRAFYLFRIIKHLQTELVRIFMSKSIFWLYYNGILGLLPWWRIEFHLVGQNIWIRFFNLLKWS